MWSKFFSKPNKTEPSNYLVAQLNDKIEPTGRYEIYEQPLEEFLKKKHYGEISGGGTLQNISGEIQSCDLDIRIKIEINQRIIDEIIGKLEEFGAPKGSMLKIVGTDKETAFGKLEGLAVYLDGVSLSDEVYEKSDQEAIISEIYRLTGTKSDWIRYWFGNEKTGLYFYGQSFNDMRDSITEFINTNPECENAMIDQIA